MKTVCAKFILICQDDCVTPSRGFAIPRVVCCASVPCCAVLLCTLQTSTREIVVRLSKSRYDPAAFAMEHNGDMLAARRREALFRSSRVPPGLTSRRRVLRSKFNNDQQAVRRRELAQRRDRMAAQRARALRDRAALFGEHVDGGGRAGCCEPYSQARRRPQPRRHPGRARARS